MQKLRDWAWANRTKLIAVAFWVALIIGVNRYMQANDLSFLQLAEQLSGVLTGTWYGPLLYIAVYLLRPLILFPASLLTILAGSIFGLWPGFLYALIAGTLSSALPYAVGRWFSGEKQPEKEAEDAIQRFFGMLRRSPFQAVLTMRLLFLPYDVVSIAAGALGVPALAFFSATAAGNLGGSFAYVGVGASLEGSLATGEVTLNPYILGVSVAILILSIVVSRLLRKRQQAAQPEAAAAEGSTPA